MLPLTFDKVLPILQYASKASIFISSFDKNGANTRAKGLFLATFSFYLLDGDGFGGEAHPQSR